MGPEAPAQKDNSPVRSLDLTDDPDDPSQEQIIWPKSWEPTSVDHCAKSVKSDDLPARSYPKSVIEDFLIAQVTDN